MNYQEGKMSLLLYPDPGTQSLKLFPRLPRHGTGRQGCDRGRAAERSRAGSSHAGSATYQPCDPGPVTDQGDILELPRAVMQLAVAWSVRKTSLRFLHRCRPKATLAKLLSISLHPSLLIYKTCSLLIGLL